MADAINTQSNYLVTSKSDDASDTLSRMHQVECFINFRKRHRVRDERVDIDPAFGIHIDDLGNIGAPARSAKG